MYRTITQDDLYAGGTGFKRCSLSIGGSGCKPEILFKRIFLSRKKKEVVETVYAELVLYEGLKQCTKNL